MINVVIYDDDKIFIGEIRKIVRHVAKTENIDIEIKYTTADARKVINYSKKPKVNVADINLYILEAELKTKMDGIELAKQIRKVDPLSYIMFATTKNEYSYWSCKYSIKASEFFIKPVGTYEFRNAILNILSEYWSVVDKITTENSGMIAITVEYKTMLLNLAEIVLVEYKRPKTIIYTKKGECHTYCSLKEMEERLKKVDGSGGIVRSHSGYILNLNNAKFLDFANSLAKMNNDMDVPISRSRKKEIRDKYENLSNKDEDESDDEEN